MPGLIFLHMAMVLVVCAVADTPIVPMGRQQPVKSHSSIKDLRMV
jgi:hypothetical protein